MKKKKQKEVKFIGKSKKLSSGERERLIDTLVKKAFDHKEASLNKRLIAWADSVYKKFVTPYLEHIDALPEYMQSKRESINVDINDNPFNYWRVSRIYTGKHGCFKMSKERLFVKVGNEQTPHISNKEHQQFQNKLEKLGQVMKKLEEEKKAVKAKIKGSVSVFNTTKQLFEGWPEAYIIYCELYPEQNNAQFLPMIPRDDLNELLGLPTVTAA